MVASLIQTRKQHTGQQGAQAERAAVVHASRARHCWEAYVRAGRAAGQGTTLREVMLWEAYVRAAG
jgi:hypothetical protein